MCKFDLHVCGLIQFFYGWIGICGSSIYMYAVRFIFVWFDLFFAVLKLNERVLLYLCAFNSG